MLALAAAAAVAFAAGLLLRPAGPSPRASLLDEVRATIAARYYRPVSAAVLAAPSVPSLLADLHDRYTAYLTPSEYATVRRVRTGSYAGIGVTVLPSAGGLLVRRTLPGPAQVAGLRPGDTILTVDGTPTAGLPYAESVGRILGVPGSRVRLFVRRGPHTLTIDVVRRELRLEPVRARLERGVGVIRIASFSHGAAREAALAARRLRGEGVRALVLDLRGDPGGLLSEALGVASVFLSRGASIVSLAGAHEPLRILYSSGGPAASIPLAILVDHGSASASEVVAGALRDHGRATLVGERTFGKSLVQAVVPLPAGAALELTVARYLTPAGHDISKGGLRPDVLSARPLSAALHLLARR